MKEQGDERILGDGDFVDTVLKEAEETPERQHRYKREGFDFDKALQLAANVFELDTREIIAAGKQPLRVQARSLLCYWAVRELGLSTTSVAARRGLGQPAVSRAVQRGERLALKQDYRLDNLRKA
jgi:hypothetical protein